MFFKAYFYTWSRKRKNPLLSVCTAFPLTKQWRHLGAAHPPPCGPVELPSPRADLFSCPSLRRTRRDNAWSPRPRSGRKPNGRAAEPPPEPSPGHVPRCERAISPTYAAKPGLTCTAACRFLCRTASDQARRASGRWPQGASEPPASFRGTSRPGLCQSWFNGGPSRSWQRLHAMHDFFIVSFLRPGLSSRPH